jgi:hypothetical protein
MTASSVSFVRHGGNQRRGGTSAYDTKLIRATPRFRREITQKPLYERDNEIMVAFPLGASLPGQSPTTNDVDVLRDDIALSIYPITSAQWQALREAAKKRGGDRPELVRDAINRLLDERDQNGGDRYIYPASPRLDAPCSVNDRGRHT